MAVTAKEKKTTGLREAMGARAGTWRVRVLY